MRGANSFTYTAGQKYGISIHAPHAGSEDGEWKLRGINDISIHAPHAGSDWMILLLRTRVGFQSTLPMRGANCSH